MAFSVRHRIPPSPLPPHSSIILAFAPYTMNKRLSQLYRMQVHILRSEILREANKSTRTIIATIYVCHEVMPAETGLIMSRVPVHSYIRKCLNYTFKLLHIYAQGNRFAMSFFQTFARLCRAHTHYRLHRV